VTLCFFSIKPKLKVFLERLSANEFDVGLENGKICPVEAPTYPPWIAPWVTDRPDPNAKSMSLAEFSAKNQALVDDRFRKIEPLVSRLPSIIDARDPFREINRHAKNHKPELNQAMTRLYFFSYICFNFDLNALLPDTWKNGRRRGDPEDEERAAMRENSIAGYEAYSGIGKTYQTIYEATLLDQFGCKTRVVDEKDEIFQPEGKRIPTLDEFMGFLRSGFGQDYLDDRRYGPNRARNRKWPERGKYTEHLTNLMEKIEGDGFFVQSIQKGVLADEMPPMCVVRLIDSLTGKRLGIGASLNGEKATAYAMAFFSMGLPKDLFFHYFGMTLPAYRWPSYGLPLSYILDRGPGTKESLIEEIQEIVPHVELALSGAGQSKAIGESTHPRSTKLDGLRVYELSNMNYLEFFRKMMWETDKENWTSDVSGRWTKELIDNGVAARPIHLWNFFDSRLRTHAVRVPEDELIRRFLRRITCRIKRSGAWISDMLCYRSPALEQSGLCRSITRNQSFEIRAFAIDMCLRHIWIDYKGHLVEAHLVPALGSDADDIDWTILDVERNIEIRRRIEKEAREHDLAVSLALAAEFEAQTELPWHQSRQTARRPKRKTPDAMDELAALHKMFGVSR
jgi:hypothetical protein